MQEKWMIKYVVIPTNYKTLSDIQISLWLVQSLEAYSELMTCNFCKF